MKRTPDALTRDMFPGAHEPGPGSLDYGTELRHVLSQALKKTPKSRYEVAARMSELVGQEISKSTLDAWTAESKSNWRFPFEYAAAFEVACDMTTALQELLCRKRGSPLPIGDEALYAQLGRLDWAERQLREQRKEIHASIKKAKR